MTVLHNCCDLFKITFLYLRISKMNKREKRKKFKIWRLPMKASQIPKRQRANEETMSPPETPHACNLRPTQILVLQFSFSQWALSPISTRKTQWIRSQPLNDHWPEEDKLSETALTLGTASRNNRLCLYRQRFPKPHHASFISNVCISYIKYRAGNSNAKGVSKTNLDHLQNSLACLSAPHFWNAQI